MGITFWLAAVLVAVLILGCLATVLLPRKQGARPGGGRIPPLVVGICTVPVAAFVFYLAQGYTVLAQLLSPAACEVIFLVLQVAAPLAAGGVCAWYYFKHGRLLRYFLLFWLNLVLIAVGAGAWGIGRM